MKGGHDTRILSFIPYFIVNIFTLLAVKSFLLLPELFRKIG
ncbi:hypothetical protein HMPREF9413_0938 [Paenibacillus sp. HGF7]|nr:hypothetical protein HMPREF9413_0938 [Paenibacillus sp. HGF7]